MANVPGYNNTAVEGSYFNGGNGNLAAPTTSRLTDCATSTTPDCAAINFMLQKSSAVNPITINSSDPLVQANRDRANNPGSVLGGMMASFPPRPTSNCAAGIPGPATPQQVIEVCASYTIPTDNTCQKNWVVEIERWWNYSCQKTGTLNLLCHTNTVASCAIEGKALTSSSTNRFRAFSNSTINVTGTPGLYTYLMEVGYACGTDGWASLDFVMDTTGQGGYITVNLTNLDDTAAVGVNGYTVYGGHPNSGPSYNGSFFPQTSPAFQIDYQWTEDIGSTVCTSYDYYGGGCLTSAYVPNIQTFFANTKLLDYCPAGYSPRSMRSAGYCDPYSGACSPAPYYTPYTVSGFFCNSEGRFLLNKAEGRGTASITSNATMPLVQGNNRIQAFWGTYNASRACGNVRISGTIYNVGPVCSTSDQVLCEAP